MQSSMLKAIVEDFGNGGTIDGDLVVSGDLTVSGGGSLSFDEIIEGTQVIDVTSTEALLVRKNGDGGDVLVVDTTNEQVKVGDNFIVNASGTTPVLTIAGTKNDILFTESDTSNLNTLVRHQTGLFRIDTINDALDTSQIRFTIDHSTGNVSIGSAEDASKFLQFKRGGSGSGVVRGSIGTNNSKLSFIGGSGTTPHMTLDSSGLLGIGTVSPGSVLSISNSTPKITLTDSDVSTSVTLDGSGGIAKLASHTGQSVRFLIGSTEVSRLDSSGNLGIGVTPTKKLELGGGTSGETLLFSNTGVNTTNGARVQANIRYKTGSYAGQNTIQIVTETQFDDSSAVVFNTGGSSTERLRITSGGLIGIGNSNPDKTLVVQASGAEVVIADTGSIPTLRFREGGATKGVVRTSSGSMQLYSGGTNLALTLDSSDQSATFAGDILVNNSTPALTLQDSDGSNQTLEILHSGANAFFTSRNGSSNGAFFFRSYNGSSFSTALELDSSQNAIFSGQIKQFRDDSSTVGTNDVVIENDGSGDASLKFSLTGATDWFAYVDNSDSDKFKIRRSTSDYLEIDESGNVAFSEISISGSTISDSSALTISSGDDIIIDATSDINLDADGGDIRFKDNGTNFVTFSSSTGSTFSGDVTVSNTDALLNLTSGASNDSVIRFNQDTTQRATIGYDDTGDLLKINNSSNFGGTDHFTIDTSGNASFSANLALSASSPQINFSGSAGDYGTFGYTEGDPDVFKWGLFQNSGQIASITMDAVSEASPSARFRFNVGGDTDSALVIDSSKRVGINESSPEAHLTVSPSTVGTTSFGGRSINYGVNINTASGRSGVTVKPANNYAIGDDNAGFQWLYAFDDGGNGDFKAFRVSEGATLVDKFYATRDGQGYFASNVGIGETSPSYKLDVVGSHSSPSKTAGDTAVVGISAGASGSELVIGGEQTGGKIWIQNRHKTANGYDFEIALQPQGGITSFGGTINANAGINFPDTQNASSDVNTLDDYEEGSGSPTVSLTGSGSVTLGTSAGNAWTKVGNIVHFQFEFSITGVSSPVGALTVALPFTSAGTYYSAGSLRVHSETFDGSPFVAINPNATVAQLKCSKSGSSTTDITPTAGTRYFFGQITYRAA